MAGQGGTAREILRISTVLRISLGDVPLKMSNTDIVVMLQMAKLQHNYQQVIFDTKNDSGQNSLDCFLQIVMEFRYLVP